ncbi:putative serine/threonine protein kinase [Blattamonas nauphoetae]|uniref:Serine/threonine protein kinase n=1 Tax=Blattamonas nauphoetae TaxID=2049346 RepID=A0ABQ9XZ99_9EUKA|nr:putative serine/threonine protein kinase [Blattamonas nauphoetae]
MSSGTEVVQRDLSLLTNQKCRSYYPLGQGCYGRVYYVKRDDNRIQAAKIVSYRTTSPQPNQAQPNPALPNLPQHHPTREWEIGDKLSGCDPRYLTRFHEKVKFTSTRQMVFFMDYADQGNLKSLLSKHLSQPLGEHDAKRIIYMIAHGLTELHKKNIIHRDIKPDNILFISDRIDPAQKQVRALLSDFGLSREKPQPDANGLVILSNPGNEAYKSPEALRGELYSHKTDVWALGCLLFVLLEGRHPFATRNGQTTTFQIDKEHIPQFTRPDLTGTCRSFLAQTLCYNPDGRLETTNNALLRHDWFAHLSKDNCEFPFSEWKDLRGEYSDLGTYLDDLSVHLSETDHDIQAAAVYRVPQEIYFTYDSYQAADNQYCVTLGDANDNAIPFPGSASPSGYLPRQSSEAPFKLSPKKNLPESAPAVQGMIKEGNGKDAQPPLPLIPCPTCGMLFDVLHLSPHYVEVHQSPTKIQQVAEVPSSLNESMQLLSLSGSETQSLEHSSRTSD